MQTTLKTIVKDIMAQLKPVAMDKSPKTLHTHMKHALAMEHMVKLWQLKILKLINLIY